MDVTGKVALITGAGVRVGRALALGLAQDGARIVVHYHRSREQAQTVVQEIAEQGGQAIALRADLREPAGLAYLVEEAKDRLGSVDILINSAAIFRRGTVLETDEANWDEHLTVNLKAPFFLCQAFARQLAPDQRGHIINIIDWRAVRPGTQYMAYTAAKAGLLALTKAMALALAPMVQVNAIAPGAILPPPGDPGGYFAKLVERIPLRHLGNPGEVLKAVRYLLGVDFVTGEVLFVTGGQHL